MIAQKSLWFALLSVAIPSLAEAAACCGGGFSLPSIIAGDDRAQFGASYSHSQVSVDNVDARGIWRRSQDHQRVETVKLEGAHLLSDRWQAGFSLPVMRRSLAGKNYSGLGDLGASLAYEYLPDWDYNPFRPKGIGFFQLTFPTGKSKAESEVGGLDSRGSGYWALGLGTLLSKTFGHFDSFITAEIHHSFSKKFSNSLTSGTLDPGLGGSVGWGAGYSFSAWRLGTALSWVYEEPVAVRGNISFAGSLERYATASLGLSFTPSDEWSSTLNYSDQTLFGNPVNTSLGRAITVQVLRRWAR